MGERIGKIMGFKGSVKKKTPSTFINVPGTNIPMFIIKQDRDEIEDSINNRTTFIENVKFIFDQIKIVEKLKEKRLSKIDFDISSIINKDTNLILDIEEFMKNKKESVMLLDIKTIAQKILFYFVDNETKEKYFYVRDLKQEIVVTKGQYSENDYIMEERNMNILGKVVLNHEERSKLIDELKKKLG